MSGARKSKRCLGKAEILRHNTRAWDAETDSEGEWSRAVSHELIEAARRGEWEVKLTANKAVPKEWFGDLNGSDVLCLASAGGQQAPLLSAAGANVTLLDSSPKQLECDRLVAERESLNLRIERGDMADLSRFRDQSFDLVFNPCSNCFAPDVQAIWAESFRVLRSGGVLLSGFFNPIFYLFDRSRDDEGVLEVKHALPYSDAQRLKAEGITRDAGKGEMIEFGHTLSDQLGGQIDAGFLISGFYEDDWSDEATTLNKYTAVYLATRALRP